MMRATATLLAMLCVWIVPAWANDSGLHASLQRAANAYLAAHTQDEHMSAVSFVVSLPHDAAMISVNAGRVSRGSATPVTTANLWQIGSNTKAMTAVLLLQLEAKGTLSIEQTVGDWLPEYPAWKGVSIHRLLDMTSGIPGYDNVPAMGTAWTSIHRRFTPEMLIGFADPIYGHAPPPTHAWNYSNTNYLLAGLIIERATHDTYGGQLQKRIFGPLGLADMHYSPNVYPKSVTDRMLSGYFDNRGPGNETITQLLDVDQRTADMSWAGAAGGVVGSLPDLARWARALYNGPLLAAKQRRELMTIVSNKTGKPIPITSASDPAGFGLGVGQATRPHFGTYWFYQGETLGYRTIYVWFPKSDVVVTLGLNSQPTTSHVGDLIDAIWAALHAAGKL